MSTYMKKVGLVFGLALFAIGVFMENQNIALIGGFTMLMYRIEFLESR